MKITIHARALLATILILVPPGDFFSLEGCCKPNVPVLRPVGHVSILDNHHRMGGREQRKDQGENV